MTEFDPSQARNWQIPAYRLDSLADRQTPYALVIPVINEGDRIRNQLRNIQAAALGIDVIIADGGSTDGALDLAFLQSTDVRALMTKTGPGRLSAQLRMAYGYCLKEGYRGIVTMDGNNKDGVEAIALFTAKLDAGYDYVQGSRYAKGGHAQNTPLDRTIANRFVHAPLLSLMGRRWYTDTTNGFRAYSAEYLLHEGVQPFRDVFQNYELLFYLTVRAGQLGMKTGQVPVTRIYPPREKTPTKIQGQGAKLAVLRQTWDAAIGRYNP